METNRTLWFIYVISLTFYWNWYIFFRDFFFHFFFDKHCDMNYFKEQRSFLKSVDQAQENELLFSFIVKLLKFPFFYFMVALEDRELKTGICKSLNRKPSNSSFSSAWSTDFKNVNFEKNHWTPSKVDDIKRSFLRSLRPNFGIHPIFIGFH